MQDALASVERLERCEDTDEEPVCEPEVMVDAAQKEETTKDDTEEESYKNQLLRLAADFDNFRKRTRREQSDLRRYGAEPIARDLLVIVDNLERALSHAENDNAFTQGVGMVVKQFADTLKTHGVAAFESKGQVFDPERHEAMGQFPSQDAKPGSVFKELERGYLFHERLLRPAKVMVAIAPAENVSGDQNKTQKHNDAPTASAQETKEPTTPKV